MTFESSTESGMCIVPVHHCGVCARCGPCSTKMHEFARCSVSAIHERGIVQFPIVTPVCRFVKNFIPQIGSTFLGRLSRSGGLPFRCLKRDDGMIR
jgi:hypothetical protein